jgi:hypothetical protein
MRFFFHRHHRLFEEAMENGSWALLSRFEIVRVGELSVEATLAEYSAPFSAEILRTGHIIYARRDVRAPRDKLCMELCSMLGAHSDVADAIHRVLFAETEDEVEQLFENRGIEPIPREELARLSEAKAPDSPSPLGDSQLSITEEELTDDVFAPTPEDVPVPEPTDVQMSAAMPGFSAHSAASWNSEDPSTRDTRETTTAPPDAPPALDAGLTPQDNGQAVVNAEIAGQGTFSGGSPRRDRPRSSGRLLSYAEPRAGILQEPSEEGSEEADRRRQIAAAAVSFVIESEREAGHQIEEMPFNNEGFDLQRTNSDGSTEYIEVKGQSGLWTETGIVLTPAELQYAQRLRDRYFLYIVEFANDPERRALYRIQDPFGKVMQFRFDSGWKSIATSTNALEPAAGFRIELEEGIGTIVDVRRAGQFYSLRVQIANSAPKTVLFVPGKMRLMSA